MNLIAIVLMSDYRDFTGMRGYSPEASPKEFSCRRVRGVAVNKEVIVDRLRSLANSKNDFVKISSAVALVKLGEDIEGYMKLDELRTSSDPWVRLEVGRAYFELGEKVLAAAQLVGLSNISDIDVLIEVAREYFRQGYYANATFILDKIEKKFTSLPAEVAQLRRDIGRRQLISTLIDLTKDTDKSGNKIVSQQRLAAATELLKMDVAIEDTAMIKEAFFSMADTRDLDIQIGLAELLRVNHGVAGWRGDLLMSLMIGRSLPVAAEALQTAVIWGMNYAADFNELQKWLVAAKDIQDIFLQYDYSPLIGNLSIRDNMVTMLIETWEEHKGLLARRRIIGALGYWGINSIEAKKFLDKAMNDKSAEGELRELAAKSLENIADFESKFQSKIRLIEQVVRNGNLPQELEPLFTSLGALWTIYGFTEARDLLLKMESNPSFSGHVASIFNNLRFRPDGIVFKRLKPYLENDLADIDRQFLSLDSLIEPWWIHGYKETRTVLRNLLERIAKEKSSDFYDYTMFIRPANALLGQGTRKDKLEISYLALQFLEKFPAQMNAELLDLYRRFIWMVGERLKK